MVRLFSAQYFGGVKSAPPPLSYCIIPRPPLTSTTTSYLPTTRHTQNSLLAPSYLLSQYKTNKLGSSETRSTLHHKSSTPHAPPPCRAK